MLSDLQRIHNSFQIVPFSAGDYANAQRLLQEIQVRSHCPLTRQDCLCDVLIHVPPGHDGRVASVALEDRLHVGEGAEGGACSQAHCSRRRTDRCTLALRLLDERRELETLRVFYSV